MKKLPEKPMYMIPPSDPRVAKWKPTFEHLANSEKSLLTMRVPPELVDKMDVGMMHELILALQHYPKLIDKLLFSIDLQFLQTSDRNNERCYDEDTWKTGNKYYRWFKKLGLSPMILFFLYDRDARFYTLAGDFMADWKDVTVKEIDHKTDILIRFNKKDMETLAIRVFNACLMFLFYTHGSDFDPQPCIEAIIAEHNLPLSYEDIRRDFEEQVKNGVTMKADTIKNK